EERYLIGLLISKHYSRIDMLADHYDIHIATARKWALDVNNGTMVYGAVVPTPVMDRKAILLAELAEIERLEEEERRSTYTIHLTQSVSGTAYHKISWQVVEAAVKNPQAKTISVLGAGAEWEGNAKMRNEVFSQLVVLSAALKIKITLDGKEAKV
ncbi:hypothetical protein, partial [Herbiconiux daphne]